MTPKKFDPAEFLKKLTKLDRRLVARGFPATSPWWRAELEKFFLSRRRRWVIRAGRRGGKSSTLCRLAVAWALWGPWHVPPGDTAVIPFVSVDRDEASARLTTIADILSAVGIAFERRGDEIVLTARRLVFRVVTASIRGTVGFTSVMEVGDEVARWESRDTAANPAREVLASLRPTMATQPFAFEILSSSPWGIDDYHAELFDQGDTEQQVASFAPTWIANPSITEEATHAFETDPKIWSREYAAIPGATLTAAFDSRDIDDAFARSPLGERRSAFVAIDASSLRGDAFAWIAGYETSNGELVIDESGAWEGEDLRNVSMRDIVNDLVSIANEHGTSVIFGDQREEASLSSMFATRGIRLVSYAWSETSKDDAVMFLRRAMREKKLCLMRRNSSIRTQLTSMKARLLPSGRTHYATNGLDSASCLITLAHAAVAGELGHDEQRALIRRMNNHPSTKRESVFDRTKVGVERFEIDAAGRPVLGDGEPRKKRSTGAF